MLEQIAAEASRVVAVRVERSERPHDTARHRRRATASATASTRPPVGAAEHLAHRPASSIAAPPAAKHLLEQRLRVAEAAVGLARDQRERRRSG
mgnify:CR=1 FL=1